MNKSKSREYRLVSLQLMNMVNIGLDKDIHYKDVVIMGMAVINASQLFLNEKEIGSLQTELWSRLEPHMFQEALKRLP
ncbi:hypothetical protein [Bacillus phage vB_BanS-Thrax5]|nr:hypothetical protein [Bacillus phage vB_BanS-Thrax5]